MTQFPHQIIKQSMHYRNSINVWYVFSNISWWCQHKSLVEIHASASCSRKLAYAYQPRSKFPPWSRTRGSHITSERFSRNQSQKSQIHHVLLVMSCPLSFTCAFTEWRSCPQPVLVLGYLGKGTDPRIERTPLDNSFRLFELQ